MFWAIIIFRLEMCLIIWLWIIAKITMHELGQRRINITPAIFFSTLSLIELNKTLDP